MIERYFNLQNQVLNQTHLVPNGMPQPPEHVDVHDEDEDEWDGVAGDEEGDAERGVGIILLSEAAPMQLNGLAAQRGIFFLKIHGFIFNRVFSLGL